MAADIHKKRFGTGMNFPFMIGLFLWCLGLFAAQSWSADPLFATTTGTDIVCSQSNPCNLVTAVFLAGDNQYVYVAGGTYTGAMDPMLMVNQDIRLIGGWDGAASGPVIVDPKANPTILDGENIRRVIEVCDMATPIISGFTIKRGYHTLKGGGMYIYNTPLLQLQDTVFYDNYSSAYGGGIYISEGTIEITNCRFETNEVVYGGGALMLGNNSSATIAKNTFTGNTASYGSVMHVDKAFALFFYNNYVLNNLGNTDTDAISLNGTIGDEVNFYNNIIAGNSGDGIKVLKYTLNLYHNTIADNGRDGLSLSTDSHAVIINNIFSGHDGSWCESIYLGSTAVIDSSTNNLFYNNASDPHTGTNPVFGNPMFKGVYHLMPKSAARDTGASTFINWDIDKEARPKGDAPDIGADEAYLSNLAPILFQLLN